MQPARRCGPDIHARTLADCLQPLQYLYLFRCVVVVLHLKRYLPVYTYSIMNNRITNLLIQKARPAQFRQGAGTTPRPVIPAPLRQNRSCLRPFPVSAVCTDRRGLFVPFSATRPGRSFRPARPRGFPRAPARFFRAAAACARAPCFRLCAAAGPDAPLPAPPAERARQPCRSTPVIFCRRFFKVAAESWEM